MCGDNEYGKLGNGTTLSVGSPNIITEALKNEVYNIMYFLQIIDAFNANPELLINLTKAIYTFYNLKLNFVFNSLIINATSIGLKFLFSLESQSKINIAPTTIAISAKLNIANSCLNTIKFI